MTRDGHSGDKTTGLYHSLRAEGVYINQPDFHYLNGGNKSSMGYREVNWSLPRAQQVIHTRQNIYDGTWMKTPSMGWMHVPLAEYHGGGAAATIEPLHEHIEHYRQMLLSNLGMGVQAHYRGPRIYDTDKTRAMVKSTVDWFKKIPGHSGNPTLFMAVVPMVEIWTGCCTQTPN